MGERSLLRLTNPEGEDRSLRVVSLQLFYLDGRLAHSVTFSPGEQPWVDRDGLSTGLFLIEAQDEQGFLYTGKLQVE